MSTTIDQKSYLQKYLGGPSKEKKKKKKTKATKGKGFKIIDDDIDLTKLRPLDGDELDILDEGEDAPQIAGIVDERPEELRKLEQFSTSSKWRVINQDDGFNSKLQIEEIQKDVKEVEKENEVIFGKMYSDSEDEKEKNDSDASPPRKKSSKNDDSDVSPPRKRERSPKKNDSKHDSDASLPRKQDIRKERKKKPSRWGDAEIDIDNAPNKVSRPHRSESSDPSPPRKKKNYDSDASPPRRKKNYNSDTSPPRKKKNYDTDERNLSLPKKSRQKSPSPRRKSPERYNKNSRESRKEKDRRDFSDRSKNASERDRRQNSDSDQSPPRRDRSRNMPERDRYMSEDRRRQSPKGRRKYDSDSDLSPPRKDQDKSFKNTQNRQKHGSDSDLSPPRKGRRKETSDRDRNISDRDKNIKRNSDSPPPTNKKMAKTLEGKMAGLQDARQLREENEEFRRKEEEVFRRLGDDISGRNAKAVSRKSKRDTSEDRQKQKEKAERQKELDAKYKVWSKGLKQVEAQQARIQDFIHEASKPVARLRDDKDLEHSLKQVEREGDPMLRYMRDKKRERGELPPERPSYKGNFPPNRFNIRPGYRWDGVDRSNGYENKYFQQQSKRKAQEEEAYKWSTEDL